MLPQKRSYEEAFIRKTLDRVQLNDYYVEHTVYKVQTLCKDKYFDITTAQNSKFSYHEDTIKQTSASATMYKAEEKVTKTELIKLFRDLSNYDIWSAMYYKQDPNNKWQDDLVIKIQAMEKADAVKYVSKDFKTFGKIVRELTGQKLLEASDNNYYMVRDLNIYFDELAKEGNSEIAAKNSIRKLDVNTLQSLIFNNVKFVLK